jgi:hypothetical protein
MTRPISNRTLSNMSGSDALGKQYNSYIDPQSSTMNPMTNFSYVPPAGGSDGNFLNAMSPKEEAGFDLSTLMAGASTGNPYVAAAGGITDLIKFGVSTYLGSRAEDRRQKELRRLETIANRKEEKVNQENQRRYETGLEFTMEDRASTKEALKKQSNTNRYDNMMRILNNKLATDQTLRQAFVSNGHRGL